jgi:hypothetical protein
MVGWEVTTMVFLVMFVATVAAICLLGVWSLPNMVRDARVRRNYHPVQPGDSRPAKDSAKPESLEGALVTQLVAGTITPAQYRHALEGLAARDEERHPLTVPPETGSADA